jgi:hypothetical protein
MRKQRLVHVFGVVMEMETVEYAFLIVVFLMRRRSVLEVTVELLNIMIIHVSGMDLMETGYVNMNQEVIQKGV